MNAVIETIQSLLNKAKDPACTEAEADAAMKMAQRLMEKNSLNEEKIAAQQASKSDMFTKNIPTGRKTRHEIFLYGISSAVGSFTSTKIFTRKATRGVATAVIVGFETDVQIAEYLLVIVKNAMETEFDKFMMTNRGMRGMHGRSLRKDFMVGMSSRIIKRLAEMKRDMADANMSKTGTSLVVLKDQIVEEAVAKMFKIRTTNTSLNVNTAAAYYAGEKAGNNVALNKAIKS